jgi:anti-sigma-K factor RskA
MSDNDNFQSEFASIADTLRDLDDVDLALIDPPADLWDRIAAAVDDSSDSGQTSVAPVTSLASRRRTSIAQRSMMLVAAAVVLVVAGTIAITSLRGDDATIVARAELGFESGFDVAGTDASAQVSLREDGERFEIAFEQAALPNTADQDADLELWLIDTDDNGNIVDLVSLGVVDATDHSFTVPSGYDPSAYDVVDISVEPHDGDDTHSGRSILRGQLST